MPDSAVRGVTLVGDHTGREKTYSGRIVDVDSKLDRKTLLDLGAFDINVGGASRAPGRVCTRCGFVGFFTSCGRCGAPTVKET